MAAPQLSVQLRQRKYFGITTEGIITCYNHDGRGDSTPVHLTEQFTSSIGLWTTAILIYPNVKCRHRHIHEH